MFKIHRIKGYAWIVLMLSAFLLFYKYVIQEYPGLIADQIMGTFHIDAATTGSIIASTLYTLVVAQLFSGILVDRYGYRVVSTFSLVLAAVGIAWFGYALTPEQALIARIIMGVGVACATVSYVKAVSDWFRPEQFPFVNSLLASAAMIGAIAGQAPLSMLFNHTGWRVGLYFCGVIGLIGALIFWVMVRDRRSVEKEVKQRKSSHKYTLKDFIAVLTKKENLLLTVYSGLTFAPVDAFAGLWGNDFLRQVYHIDHTDAAGMISMIFLGLAIGAPIIGKISELTGRRLSLMTGFHLLGLLSITAVFYLPMPMWCASVCLFLFGFAVSAFMLSFAVGRMINPLWVLAFVAALINTGEPIIGGSFDALVGWFLDLQWVPGQFAANGARLFSTHSYQVAFAVLPIGMLLALVALLGVREKRCIEK